MAYFLRRAARSILGESRYGKLRPIAAYWREQTRGPGPKPESPSAVGRDFVAEPAGGHSGEREASIEILGPAFDHIGPTQNELALLHLREVATTLSLGLQYSYNSWIEGDIVEFGTASGFTACTIAKAMVFCELSRPPKRLHCSTVSKDCLWRRRRSIKTRIMCAADSGVKAPAAGYPLRSFSRPARVSFRVTGS
jgi:hypothetical protein